MVIVKISGGLGNQLFQYSFGKYLSKLLNTKVKYDLQTNRKLRNFTPREIESAIFGSETEIATKPEIKRMKFFTKGIPERLERKMIQKMPFLNNSFFVESPFAKRLKTSYFRDDCYYDGYWQSYKYPISSEASLFNKESIIKALTETNKEILKNLSNNLSIGLHIRRSDYLSNKKNASIFEECGKKYYEKAIQYFSSNYTNSVFYIFSDDLSWAVANFKGNEFIHVTDNQPLIDFFLMSSCKHNIIANSTFSWWAAWLNPNKNKIVIAPEKWYRGEINDCTMDLLPDNWIKI
jgi:hypothetical protein